MVTKYHFCFVLPQSQKTRVIAENCLCDPNICHLIFVGFNRRFHNGRVKKKVMPIVLWALKKDIGEFRFFNQNRFTQFPPNISYVPITSHTYAKFQYIPSRSLRDYEILMQYMCTEPLKNFSATSASNPRLIEWK